MKIPYTEEQLKFVDNITDLLNSHFKHKYFTSTTEKLKHFYNNPIPEGFLKYFKQFPRNDFNSLYITADINEINFRIDYLSKDKLGLIVYFKIGKIYFSNKYSKQIYSDVNELIEAIEKVISQLS